jgi:hypothetical protein
LSEISSRAGRADTTHIPFDAGQITEAYEGASGQVRVRENRSAEHKMTLLLAERN